MKKLRNLAFILVILVILSGCSKSTTSSNKKEEVKDDEVINTLTNQIISLEYLTKTRDFYTNGEGKAEDYTDEDKIRYGIESRIGRAGVPVLTKEQIAELATKGITNVASYVDLSDVSEYINGNFEESVKTYTTVTGCPTYTYDENAKKFYIQAECQSNDATTIVSTVDKITKESNKYYVTVYAGLNDGNAVYGDFEKKKTVKTLTKDETYSITNDDKAQFTKFTYTFEKNSNDNYIFKTVTKEK